MRLAPEQLADPRARKTAQPLRQLLEAGGAVTPQALIARTDDAEIASMVAAAVHLADTCESKRQALDDCLTHLEHHRRVQQLATLRTQIETAELTGNHEQLGQLLRDVAALTKRGDSQHGHRESESSLQQAR